MDYNAGQMPTGENFLIPGQSTPQNTKADVASDDILLELSSAAGTLESIDNADVLAELEEAQTQYNKILASLTDYTARWWDMLQSGNEAAMNAEAQQVAQQKIEAQNRLIAAQNAARRLEEEQASQKTLNSGKLPKEETLSNIEYGLSLLNDEEAQLARENHLDLAGKLPDGSPKYIFAIARDGKWHIYDMSQNNYLNRLRPDQRGKAYCGASIARVWGYQGGNTIIDGKEYTSLGQGEAIVPAQSGQLIFSEGTSANQGTISEYIETYGANMQYFYISADEGIVSLQAHKYMTEA